MSSVARRHSATAGEHKPLATRVPSRQPGSAALSDHPPQVQHVPSCPCGGGCPRCQAQSNLEIGAPNNAYEREADAVADRVMGMADDGTGAITKTASGLQRQCAACPDDETLLQHKAESAAGSAHGIAPASVHEVLRSSGEPLPAPTRAYFEPRFGHDFSEVRVHADAVAQASAQAVNAKAYTVGTHVVFAAGEFAPDSQSGKSLLAHELTHVVQQSGAGGLAEKTSRPTAATAAGGSATMPGGPVLQRQKRAAAPPPCPTAVSLSSGRHPVHVPACGTTPVVATSTPATAPVTWSLANGSTQSSFSGAATTVAAGTSISNSAGSPGAITVDPAQSPGFIAVQADGAPGCRTPASGNTGVVIQLNFASTPTGIGATRDIGPLATSATTYGAQFEHTLTAASGNPAHLFMVHVNEHFSGLATPDAATHAVPTPFGTFTLHSNPWQPNSSAPGWDITSGGVLRPDNIGIERNFIDAGRFVASASNPTPATTLTPSTPVGFSVRQDLHWFCPQAAIGSQWVSPPFTTLTHTRHLWDMGGVLRVSVGIPAPFLVSHFDDYTGQPAIIHATASPNPVTVSPTLPRGAPRGTPRPTPNTARISADTLPASLSGLTGTHELRYSIRGPRLGCSIDAVSGQLAIGTTPGTITVRVRDVNTGNHNFDEVRVTIAPASAAPAKPAPSAPTPTGPPPGLHPSTPPGEYTAPPPLPVAP